MYSTCIFCNSSLGRNEALENFPIGRRLAFDAARGRLWVVCGKCERWNLSPLETRWEAIEDAERAFRETRLRISTDNIGLAELKDGLELVRIGAPPQLELAGWRYGDQFGRRRRKHVALGTLVVAGGLGAGLVSLTGFAIAGLAAQILYQGGSWALMWQHRRVPRAFIRDSSGALLTLTSENVRSANLVRGKSGMGWHLRIQHSELAPAQGLPPVVQGATSNKRLPDAIIEGAAAQEVLAIILPHINASGGSGRRVRDAISVIDAHRSTEQLLHSAAAMRSYNNFRPGENNVAGLPGSVRLALEMVLHEDHERRALQGELAELERRWRDAEEIARISDSLLLPRDIETRLESLRRRP